MDVKEALKILTSVGMEDGDILLELDQLIYEQKTDEAEVLTTEKSIEEQMQYLVDTMDKLQLKKNLDNSVKYYTESIKSKETETEEADAVQEDFGFPVPDAPSESLYV